jgi:uncharacterized phage protein gp47/JayE
MVAQLRLLDNSASAEVGTPERKIIDTVASALSLSQISLTGLQGALDINSKFGSNLDSFVGLFGFARVQGTSATGFVVFSTNVAPTVNVTIPAGTIIVSNTQNSSGISATYSTTASGVLQAGQTSSPNIPVTAVNSGSNGNAAVSALTIISTSTGNLVAGITSVTNPAPITGGTDDEDDNSLKVRFQNTVFRNLAGTQDQFLALAVSTAYSTKANVVGPISQYVEYIQVPSGDDTTTIDGQSGGGLTAGQYTTALSTIPYAQWIYTTNPVFITDSSAGIGSYFYQPGIDFNFNWPALNIGDTYRYSQLGANIEPYVLNQPNWTFLNVYNGTNDTVQAVNPGDVLLVEYFYMSSESRNSLVHNVTNAVDVFVDGTNPTLATNIFTPPTSAGANTAGVFDNPANMFYLENFRRDGKPAKRPQAGNVITPLFYTPLTGLPNTITIGDQTYYIGINYWLVHDVSQLGGTIQSRDGIEWSMDVCGQNPGDPAPPVTYNGSVISSYNITGNPADADLPWLTTGNHITDWATDDPIVPVTVTDYSYDQNVVDLQAALEAASQITTSVLAHNSIIRYFKLDITIIYSQGSSQANVNANIQTALQTYFNSQYFGTVIQMSTLLQIVGSVPGVANVRWTVDIPNTVVSPPAVTRVYETNINGAQLGGIHSDRVTTGRAAITTIGQQAEVQNIYVTGQPTNGTFTLSYGTHTTSTLTIASLSASALQSAINGLIPGAGTVTVAQINTVTTGVNYPIYTYQVTFNAPTCTISDATPGVVTLNNHGLVNGDVVSFATTNTLPAPLAPNMPYYVVAAAANTFEVSSTSGGAAIPTTTAGAGTHSLYGQTYVLPVIAYPTSITTGQYLNDYDFFLRDNELPQLAPNPATGDTLAGLIIRPRAQNTWIGPAL